MYSVHMYIIDIRIYIDEITTSDTPEIDAMKAEFYKLKCSLDSAEFSLLY